MPLVGGYWYYDIVSCDIFQPHELNQSERSISIDLDQWEFSMGYYGSNTVKDSVC